MVIKTSKKPKILIFIGVHPGLKFAPIRFVQFVPRFVTRCRLYSFIISMIKTTLKMFCFGRVEPCVERLGTKSFTFPA